MKIPIRGGGLSFSHLARRTQGERGGGGVVGVLPPFYSHSSNNASESSLKTRTLRVFHFFSRSFETSVTASRTGIFPRIVRRVNIIVSCTSTSQHERSFPSPFFLGSIGAVIGCLKFFGKRCENSGYSVDSENPPAGGLWVGFSACLSSCFSRRIKA